MGLQSALSTALTGLTAAETTIDVVGNNVANANTVGFKESHVSFATQFLQTQSIGSAPTSTSGGTNPRQTGLGVKVAEISPEFTQGTIEISSNPLDLAIQGDGFFIVQGQQGETLYTRNGQFKTNANNEIVTINGQRVMGYTVDENFVIQPTALVPLQIPIGASAIAQATQHVTLTGSLNPNATVGSIPEIIQSQILSDRSHAYPTTNPTSAAIARSSAAATTVTNGGAGATIDGGVYSYRFTFVDDDGNESPASTISPSLSVPGPGTASINLDNIPQPTDPAYTSIRIYRNDTSVSASEYRLVDTLDISGGPDDDYTDTTADAALTAAPLLSDTGLANNNYSYYITYYNSLTGEESRPGAQFGPVTVDSANSPRIRLSDIPAPTPPPGGEYDRVRIYRNVATDPNSFYLVDTLNTTTVDSYIDSKPDATIAVASNLINLDGPAIQFGTLLTDVVARDGANYNTLFGLGELTFTGDKGGRDLASRTLDITATTTVQDLLTFMEQSMGVIETASESTFPTPPGGYGGTITADSRLSFTSNMGTQNALSIDLTAFQFTPTSTGVGQTVPLKFGSTQTANGEGATADFIVYDSLGTQVNVRVTTVLEERSSTGAKFRWIATSPDHEPDTGFSTVVGTGVFTTDSDGRLVSVSDDRVAVDRGDSPAASPLEFQLDFDQVRGLGTDNKVSANFQDGFPPGVLTSFIISDTGRIEGRFSNGSSRDLGQIRMARFSNNSGLEQRGENLFAVGVNSGLPIESDPGSQGIGSVKAGAVELSNADIGQNLIELILASTQYRGGARVITAVQQLFDELLALRR
jgi:flagellar hook protein FlgE